MKNFIILVLVLVFAITMSVLGIGCKEETEKETVSNVETTEEATEEATEEVEEEVEIVKQEVSTWDLCYIETEQNATVAEAYNAQSESYYIEYTDALAGLDFVTEGVQKIRLALENGIAPDLIGHINAGGMMTALVESGSIQDLTQVYKDRGWDQKIPTKFINEVTIDGKIYGVPISIGTVGCYYNKAIFEELNLEIPSTWDEFIELLETLKAADYYPMGMGLSGGWPSAFMASQYGYLTAGSEYRSAMRGEIPWTESAGSLTALEWFYKIGMEYSNPDVAGIDHQQSLELFYSQQTAMVLRSTAAMGHISEGSADFDLGFFYMPTINAETDIKVFGGLDKNFVVNSTGNIEGAYDYIDWILNDEGVANTLDVGKFIPVLKDYEVPDTIEPLFYEVAMGTKQVIDNVGSWPVVHMPSYLFGNFNQFVQGMMIGELTPAEVLEELQKDREQYDEENE